MEYQNGAETIEISDISTIISPRRNPGALVDDTRLERRLRPLSQRYLKSGGVDESRFSQFQNPARIAQ